MVELIGIPGSLRRGSFNAALLRAAARLMPDDTRFSIHTIEGIPLYNADDENTTGIPEAVTTLKEAIVASDGLLLATPEYNNSIPGVFKNTIDWLSRPPVDIKRVFHGRPVALIGASAGGFGTILSQSAWLPVLRTLRADFWSGGRLMVARGGDVVDEHGEIADEKVRGQLATFVRDFTDYVGSRRQ